MKKRLLKIGIPLLVVALVLSAGGSYLWLFKGHTISIPGYKIFMYNSGAMYPTIQLDQILWIKRTAPERIEEGDYIAFRRDDIDFYDIRWVISIDYAKDGLVFTTMNNNSDQPRCDVPAEMLVGRIVWPRIHRHYIDK